MSELVQVGQPLPKLKVMTTDAQTTTVQVHLSQKQTLLYFLHGTWCPQCVGQYHLLQRYHQQIKAAGTELIVITGEEIETLTAFLKSARPRLEYTVLTDPKRSTYHTISAGDDTVSIVVDGQGTVRWFARWPEHLGEPGYETILQTLRDVGVAAAGS